MLDSKIADINNAPYGGFAGSITCALFLQRFVERAKTWLHFDIYAWTPRASPAGRKAASARPRARSMRCWSERYGDFDPRLTPARPTSRPSISKARSRPSASSMDARMFEVRDTVAPLRQCRPMRRWKPRR